MKLWEKDKKTEEAVMSFTVGNDPEYDKLLAPYDIIGSMAHAIMLGETGILSTEESKQLIDELSKYYPETKKESFSLNPDDEDIHSHLENYLVLKVGDAGKKIHTARSRNDQVMVALQLMMKEEWRLIIDEVNILFNALISQAEKHSSVLIPGYTHTQVAMPSSIGIWLGAYAESLVSDLKLSKGIISVIDQNALGSAAGFGSSFPIDRDITTKLAGFGDLLVSSVSAQLNRGKLESTMAFGLSSFAMSLSRLASDMILFMGQDLNFISFPVELTTGSSIMPHKKNPDVLELIRAHCNTVIQMPTMLNGLSTNLISGYHRDFQLTKEILVPGIEKLKQCLAMMTLMVSNMKPREGILKEKKYTYIFSVEEVNKKVMDGKSFRDAYREVSKEIESGEYSPVGGSNYTHVGSIGNPGLNLIKKKMESTLSKIKINAVDEIVENLSGYYEEKE
ncbi:MAG: argininosuccinate lyase [Bacteroidales bacterium]|jgi:argininosuccinate lyase|nr:argininosuccinate lyase [Bacteroidales bacterium]